MKITILAGMYKNNIIDNKKFELVRDLETTNKGTFVTVKPAHGIGEQFEKIRIKVTSENLQYPAGYAPMSRNTAPVEETFVEPNHKETDEEVIARIADRFEILEEMTKAAISADIRGMIVVGPPGVGKSFGVIRELESLDTFDALKSNGDSQKLSRYEVLKGAITALGLYVKLYQNKDKGQVVVFDDCDSILGDELSLNLLKAVLDSGKKRKICWNADSNLLKAEEIPKTFNFEGSVIFITNINFDNVKSKKIKDHLEALQSRCHYLDLSMHGMRDRMLRIVQIHRTGDLFSSYRFENGEGDEIVQYMKENVDKLREVSLRMAIKIADLHKVSKKWKRLAEATVMKNSY